MATYLDPQRVPTSYLSPPPLPQSVAPNAFVKVLTCNGPLVGGPPRRRPRHINLNGGFIFLPLSAHWSINLRMNWSGEEDMSIIDRRIVNPGMRPESFQRRHALCAAAPRPGRRKAKIHRSCPQRDTNGFVFPTEAVKITPRPFSAYP